MLCDLSVSLMAFVSDMKTKRHKILYLGDDTPHTTSQHRAESLRRLEHEVTVINPRSALPRSWLTGALGTRVGFWPFCSWVNRRLRRLIGDQYFDIAWVDGGADLSPGFHRWLRQRGAKIINYCCDNPFSPRDGRKWDLYRQSVRYHDLTVVVRESNITEAKRCGARKVRRVFMSYDRVAHAPLALTEDDKTLWASDVVFVGSWMPERGPFMVDLIKAGVPLSIRGDRWTKAPEYALLQQAYRGPAIWGEDYVKAIQSAKVAIGMLSKGNRDLHTTRSVEVPYIGGAVLCAERTAEHLHMLREGSEAMYWKNAEECALCCKRLLVDEGFRTSVVHAAHARILALQLDNDSIVRGILDDLATTSS